MKTSPFLKSIITGFLFLIGTTLIAQDWTQIGLDIDGEAAGDRSGTSVSLSGSGNFIAIGAPTNGGGGHVRVYQNILDVWTQVGADIDAEAAGDIFGTSVSINAAGDVVAIGAPNNDGGGVDAGHTRIYQFSAGVWTQIGADIDGEAAGDLSGTSVSLNNDGTFVAIGATINTGSGPQSGHVRVFENVAGVWTQVGADIDGEASYDWSGCAVSLSSDGTIVGVGAYKNDGMGSFSGHARVYEFGGGTWSQIGGDMDGEAAGDEFGRSISLSGNGSVFAIGGAKNDGVGVNAGHARVFEYIGGVWSQIGGDLDGAAADDDYGWAVSLDELGQTVAIGGPKNDESTAESGQVRVFDNIGGVWIQKGTNVLGEMIYDRSGWSVGLDDVGNILADAAYVNDGTGVSAGHVRLYRFDCDSLITPFSDTTLCFDQPLILDATSAIGAAVNWDMGVTNGIPFFPASVGVITYTATSVSPSDCPLTVEVTVLALPVVTATVDPIEICIGESATFTGGGADSYVWNSGVTDGVAFTPVVIGTNTYTVTGTAPNGCINTATVDLTVHALPIVTATATPVEICLGESILFTGGGADTYVWDGGATDGVPFVPATAGTFTFTVTGTNATTACENTATVDVIVNDNPVATATATPDEICLGESITFTGGGADTYAWDLGVTDGVAFFPAASGTFTHTVIGTITATGCTNSETIDVTVHNLPIVTATVSPTEICLGESATFTGGGAASYAWDLGVTDGVPFIPAAAGTVTYTVIGTSADGCVNIATVDLIVNPTPIVTATATPIEICLGETITFTGGGTDVYVWDGGVTDGIPFAPATAGTFTYTVTGTDAITGCESTATIDVIVNDLPAVTASAAPHEICLGESIVFTGGGADTYVWDLGVVDGVAFFPAASGTFTHTVIGTITATGCTNSETVDVTIHDLPVVLASVSPTEICLGESATFTGGGATSYAWDAGVTDGIPFIPAAAGTFTYTVTGTSAEGCESTATVDLIINPLPVVTATATPSEVCLGESITLTGGGADLYVWDGGVTDGLVFTPAATGTVTYTVVGTIGATGCENIATVDITVYPNPVVTATATPSEICMGESIIFTGGGADTYVWDMGATDGTPFFPTDAGTFTFTVIGYLGPIFCENTNSVTVTVYELPEVTATVEPSEICFGESVIFTGSGAATYIWDHDVVDGEPHTPDMDGIITYTVIGISSDGCQRSTVVDVVVLPAPDLTAELDTIINTGGTANLIANSSLPGSYVWSPDFEIECPTCNVTTASPGNDETFIVLFTAQNGCFAYDTVIVLVNYIEGIGVASGFSPNADGINDVLFVQGYNLDEVHLEVYNKYGERVFATSDQDIGWDGTYRNKDENPGVFTWVLDYNLVDGRVGRISGNTTLFR
ncbi:MAG: gliding motility-associated-like protein [Crocinitomix sp.]|jgi:gliding motility-associated-like protein